MNANEKAINVKGTNCNSDRKETETPVNQEFKNKIHITKHKKEILKEMLICFRKGGINGIKDGSLNELAEIISNNFCFDCQGDNGEKTTKKESILRSLKLCEQRMRNDEC
ncbi:hypothetical protein [Bacteroides sp.]